jgi:mRNA interferase MazF
MEMSRGDLIVVAMPGDYGKPRPALVVQDDAFDILASVTVLPLTSTLRDSSLVRLTVEPTPQNGLEQRSQVMVDKAGTVDRRRIGGNIGRIDPKLMRVAEAMLARFLGLAVAPG